MRLQRIEAVDEHVLCEIVDRIVRAVDPDRIILFGSYGYGQPHAESDLDLLVIMPSDIPRWRRAVSIYQALRGLVLPKDIVVYTEEEIDEWSDVPQAFITSVIHQGRVLYEKKQG